MMLRLFQKAASDKDLEREGTSADLAHPNEPHLREQNISPRASIWLDALRVFLLAQVLLGHLAAIALPEISEVAGRRDSFALGVLAYRLMTRFGAQSAYVFVFLSGLLVGGPLLARARQGEILDFAEFVRRRFARIIPALWIALAVGATFDVVGAFVLGAADVYSHQKAYNFLGAMTFENFGGDLLCLQPTFVGMFGSNGPLWTLGYIAQFYLAGFALSRALATRAHLPLIASCCGFLAAAIFRPEWGALFVIWCFGALARNLSVGGWDGRLYFAVGFALFVAANRAPTPLSILMCGACGFLLFNWARVAVAAPPPWLSCILQTIAGLSYEIYMTHYPAAFFIFAVSFGAITTNSVAFLTFLAASLPTVGLVSIATRYAAGLAVCLPTRAV